MLRDELIDITKTCIETIKQVKGYDFKLICVDDGKPTSDYDEKKLGENKTVFHITLSFYNPEGSNQNTFEITKIISNEFPADERLEKSKGILQELNKAAKDFLAGREYEPTYMEKLRNILSLSSMFGGGGWYL